MLLTQSIPTLVRANTSGKENPLPATLRNTLITAPDGVYLPIILNGDSFNGVSSPEAALAELEKYQDTPSITGTTYYVANNGDDDNNGTTSDTPWQTIAKVNGETFSPGDGILFKRGDS